MFKTNQYFDGKVVSIGLESAEGTATVGVMQAGEYEFGTGSIEVMTVISGELTIQQFFAGLYGHTDVLQEPMSAGRQMGGHFMTHSLNEDGSWKNLTTKKNSSADI